MRQYLRKLNIRLLTLAVAAVLLLSLVPSAAAAEASGRCGDNLTWSLSGDTLTISGTGAMYDFSESTMSPWYEYRDQIAAVRFPEGLTRVGALAFFDCTALRSVTLPDSVTEVGWHAFDGCSGMVMLDLGDNLRVIEEAGFKECGSLKALRLPDTLTTIGFQAFYRCASISEVTVPASVTDLGMTAFAFCYSLVRADIRAPITTLPDWTFYGCSMLAEITLSSTIVTANPYAFYDCTALLNVEYSGSSENLAQIKSDIERDLEVTATLISVGGITNGNSTTVSTDNESDDGSNTTTTTTTTVTDNATINSNTTIVQDETAQGAGNTQLDITLESADGWNEVTDILDMVADSDTAVDIDVYIKDDSDVPADVLNRYAGTDVTVTIHTAGGAEWTIDCSQLSQDALSEDCGFSYQRIYATEDQLAIMGSSVGYEIRFNRSVEVNAQVRIRLSSEHSHSTATLYQLDKKSLTKVQSVIVDNEGYACFYLGAVDQETVYLIGIDVPGVSQSEAIVPASMYSQYGISDNASGIEYVITGRSSSWGMSLGQVSWILVAVMVGSVGLVGVFMFTLNKRRLKRGYVPEIYDEDE